MAVPVSPEKRRVTRHTRAKEEVKIDDSLFNFEEDPGVINPDQPILLVDHVEGGTPLPIDFEFSREKIQLKTNMVDADATDDAGQGPVKRGRSLRKSTIKKVFHEDPLEDELYSIYHRRMEKEEKKMMNRDREKLYTEADKMKNQLEALQQNDWTKALPMITYIRDIRDINEMNEKREWTMNSLQLLLGKFEAWKKQEDRVFGKSKNFTPQGDHQLNDLKYYTKLNRFDYIGESETDEEEDNLSLTEIKKKRLKKRAKKFGPTIKIKFGDIMVVAEPFKHPRIENT